MSFLPNDNRKNYFFLRFKHGIRFIIARYPSLFLFLLRVVPKYQNLIVCKNTDITIEGYPRSGNTFAAVAFQLAQKSKVKIARHTHSSAQIIKAIRIGIPALVLIRKPMDAVISLFIRRPHINISKSLKDYIYFYERLMPYKNKFVIGDFEEVIRDMGTVIEKINKFYDTNFIIFNHTKAELQQCFRIIDEMDMKDTGRGWIDKTSVARPSNVRKTAIKSIKEKFNTLDDKNLLYDANKIYKKFLVLK